MLLVHRLFGDPEYVGDVLPRPALTAGIGDLRGLEGFGETPQRRCGLKPDPGVGTAGR